MKTTRIDNTNFPPRKVVSVRNAKNPVRDVTRIMTLECGHDVGLREGFPLPEQVPCYLCTK